MAWRFWWVAWWFSCCAVPADGWRPHGWFDEKDYITPVTFGHRSGKFPSMKAWISICTIISVAGMVTVLAQETKTNTPTSATASTPNTNEVAVPPPTATTPAPAPAVAKEVKPPAVASPKSTKAVVPAPMTSTSAPAPAVANEVKPPAVAASEETNAVPAQPEITAGTQTPTNAAAPPNESSGTGRKRVWFMGVAVLVVVIGLAIFLWQRFHAASRGSLITSALAEDQKSREDKNAPPPMT